MNDNEEELLRSVALQNAKSILQARQRAEDALREAKESLERKTNELARSLSLMRATLEATNDAILVTDSQGLVTHFNEQFVRIWRLPRGSFESRQHRELLQFTSLQFDDPEAFLERVNEIYASSQEISDELWLSDGRIIERFSKLQSIDDDVIGRVWSFRDVTQQKHADQLKARLAAVVESSDDAIISKNLNGIIATWNAGAQRTFGYTADEAIGQPVLMLIPPDRAHEEEEILSRLRRGQHIEHYETERVCKDGVRIHVSLTVSPIKDSNGVVIGASKIARDITERRRAEEALRHAAEEREELLDAERAARSEAERVSLMKDEFLATLSHELRTPLNAILGWAQVLVLEKSDPADVQRGLDAIQRNARAQTQLIEDLLDMSRIISGKVRLDVQWTDLAGIIDAALDSVRPSAEAKGIRIRRILDPKAGPVSGDPTRLQQVVWNLLTNAIKFTPKGGSVDVLLERVNSHVEITIHDSGMGIEPEFLPLVFERFRQADSSSTRSFGGLGLGLSIVKNLVELHGGSIRAKSAGAGQGATFIVSLPLAPIRGNEKREHPTTEKAPAFDYTQIDLTGVKVLVIDDEPDARALVSRVLTHCHAEVAVGGSAAEGLEIIQTFLPDVLLSDIGMPQTDGYEFIRQVRRLAPERGGRTPAIALTAFARSEDRTRAMMAGYQVHISKPIEPQELVATVRSLASAIE
jgi:PAS domain S-box-containing protein